MVQIRRAISVEQPFQNRNALLSSPFSAVLLFKYTMKRLAFFFFAILCACGKLKEPTAPGGSSGEPIDPTATFTRVQNEIFTPTCAAIGCHDPLGQQQQLVLSSGRAYGNTVGKTSTELPSLMRVTAGDPNNSYLYRKIIGSGITGAQMPQAGPYLNDAQIKLIRDWIRRGAPND